MKPQIVIEVPDGEGPVHVVKRDHARPGQRVLLSIACSSDQAEVIVGKLTLPLEDEGLRVYSKPQGIFDKYFDEEDFDGETVDTVDKDRHVPSKSGSVPKQRVLIVTGYRKVADKRGR